MNGTNGDSARSLIRRRASDHAKHQTFEVEFVGGGPLDGARLQLDIVRDAPGSLRVLEMTYVAIQRNKHRRTHDHNAI